MTERWTSRSGEQLTSETMTLYDVAARAIAPLAQRTGLSVVETLARGPQPPAWFVSHWWGEPTADFVRCLEVHSKDRGLDEDATYYWVCAYALRQSALGDELRGGVGVSPFVRAIQLCDGTVSVLDRGAIATSRAWCALELFETTISRGAGYLHDIYTAHEHVDDRREQHERREAVGLVDGFAAADRGDVDLKAFRETHFPLPTLASAEVFALERAEAAQPADLAAILGAVGAEQPLLDATVRARFGVARLRTLICRGADDAALRALLDALRASRLRKVSTGNSSSAPSAAKLALLCASMPPTLEELRLPSALPSVVQPLCEAIEAGRLPRLRTLDLGRCKLGAADVALLSAALASAGCGVVGLDLAFNQLGDEGSSALAGLLEHNTTLTSLDLRRAPRTGLHLETRGAPRARALRALSRCAAPSPLLTGRHNAVGNKGAAALARSLECNGTLTSLNLRCAPAATCARRRHHRLPPSSRACAPALRRSNKIGDEGAHALAKALERNSVLKNLDLRWASVLHACAALRGVRSCRWPTHPPLCTVRAQVRPGERDAGRPARRAHGWLGQAARDRPCLSILTPEQLSRAAAIYSVGRRSRRRRHRRVFGHLRCINCLSLV